MMILLVKTADRTRSRQKADAVAPPNIQRSPPQPLLPIVQTTAQVRDDVDASETGVDATLLKARGPRLQLFSRGMR
jgi:hypothetical protein